MERELVFIKPDGVKRGLIGEVIRRFERKGLKVVALKMLRLSREEAEKLYSPHMGKPFFKDLVEFVTSGPIVAMVLEGDKAIEVVRRMIGKTNPKEAELGTIRGDFAMDVMKNVVHASDSPESFEREVKILFKPEEIYEYKRADEEFFKPSK